MMTKSPKAATKPGPKPGPKQRSGRLHLDRRAGQIADVITAEGGDDDDLLTTQQLAVWFGVTPQWLEAGRAQGYGPPFIRLAGQLIRYRRSGALVYLKQRQHASTAEYSSRRVSGRVSS